jgi:hypothetical protein
LEKEKIFFVCYFLDVRIVGNKKTRHKKGFSEELNKFLELSIEFSKQRTFIPKVFINLKLLRKWKNGVTGC